MADLTDNTVFADVGVDSLLGLTISARFKEELDMDVDFNALYDEYPTVGHLKAALCEPGASASGISTPGSSDTEAAPPPTCGTGIPTPGTCITTPDSCPTPGFDFQKALEIISEESGLAMEDLTDATNFADSGVDSLLSLVIVSRFRDELDLDIQHESLFLECQTVADLRVLLGGDQKRDLSPLENTPSPIPTREVVVQDASKEDSMPQHTSNDSGALEARKRAVDDYVRKYTAGFSIPASSPSPIPPNYAEKVVLITGASGSLGSNLVYHMAQLSDVKTVVCLNRENKAEPYVRQQKAMREKGIRFPEALKPKLLVFQTDSSKPMFGLTKGEYDGLVRSVTHLIHNAWPMSAKRPLTGFESQFQIMGNLLDFACDVASRRPADFKFSFQMVSSIGVVGHYGLAAAESETTVVPEERVGIDSVLPNGYGEAKWGCERMLDETLHMHPERFRTMAVRLGQIVGSKTSGYWNPLEHFGFVIKSSQILNALPDVDGTVYWTPVNDVAGALSDLVLSDVTPYPVYHIDNPVGQSWRAMNEVLADALSIPNLIPFQEWVEKVRAAPQRNNPASTLLEFLDSNYLRMSCGGLVLDVNHTLEHSKTLSAVGPVSEEVVRKYIHIWKEIGFIN
jgi:thioester reductase-like protein/acyl carrier protein